MMKMRTERRRKKSLGFRIILFEEKKGKNPPGGKRGAQHTSSRNVN